MNNGAHLHPRDRPAYTFAEAAGYVHMPTATLQTWALGRDYPTAGGDRTWRPLFEIADAEGKRLSFLNLVEVSVLAALRREHRIAVPKIRTALDYVRDHLHVERPLYGQEFETDGVDLFVECFGQLVNASRRGQLTIREFLRAALMRIERDTPTGMPIRLFAATPDELAKSPFVGFDPTIAFGRPVVVRSGVPIASIANRFRAGDSVDGLAEDYRLDRAAVEEAIRQAELLRAA